MNGRESGPTGSLSDEQRLDWLQLIRSDNVGPSTFRQLINRFGGAATALAALPELIARKGGTRKIRIADRSACEREFEALAHLGGQLIVMGDREYPALLREIDSAPPIISVLGQADVLVGPMIAIVGARNASAAGLAMAERLARELALHDYAIVSGLARGVDRQAHATSLMTGTIAVLAGGFHNIYPPEHRSLADRICEQGALISEMPIDWQARGRDFPRRNRIVSGLAYGTIVVEAAKRSGSLITARFANEQGREVFAVPGSPLDPRAEGPNQLLRQGATICVSADNVVEALAPMREGRPASGLTLDEGGDGVAGAENLWDETDLFGMIDTPRTMAGMEFDDARVSSDSGKAVTDNGDDQSTVYMQIADLMGRAPMAIDELVRLSGSSVAEVKVALLELELDGRLERHGGDLVSMVK